MTPPEPANANHAPASAVSTAAVAVAVAAADPIALLDEVPLTEDEAGKASAAATAPPPSNRPR